ncbi:hypothetical protein BD626DRAFT_555866 [Schizophyllum amplum]|uniref:Uncharacterized protein n=1 Tax=Schizophyllum amplum TaxID=97359 RepID=A0A550CLT3_9AGAR|nr:hypothetical protein BD626DRAFT_555866 [Auriculariopsis ampla]
MASPNSSPAKGGLRSRMGTMLRRTSSVFKDSRPSSPTPGGSVGSRRSSVSRKSSKSSLKQLDTQAPVAPSSDHHAPSPIAESPAREAAAALPAEGPAIGPSPLANAISAESTQSVRDADVNRSILAGVTEDGPGAYVDEPEEIPSPSPEPAPRQDAATSPMQSNDEPSMPTPAPPSASDAPARDMLSADSHVISPEGSDYFDLPVPQVAVQPGPVVPSLSMDDDINEANAIIGQAPQKQVEITRPGTPESDNATTAWAHAADANSGLNQTAESEHGNAGMRATYDDPFADPITRDYVVEGMPIPRLSRTAMDIMSMPEPYTCPSRATMFPRQVPPEHPKRRSLRCHRRDPALLGGSAPTLYDGVSFAQHEWIRYALPDPGCTAYYVHPGRAITTDIDLTVSNNLAAVQAYLSSTHRQRDDAEMWLARKDEPERKQDKNDKRKADHGFVVLWVDHGRRRCVKQDNGGLGDKDAEARYWAFMEQHPAHTALPMNARNEAIEALMWIYSDIDNVLPDQPGRHASAPFSREECQSILRVLRDQPQEEFGDSVIQIRLIARIMRRVAQWRAQGGASIPKHSSVADVAISVVSALCLGLPYLFLANDRTHAVNALRDLENSFSHVVSLSPAVYLAGACTCIMGAVVLSASVTLLSLPGLDSVARVAGFVAALISAFSVVSAVVALIRFQADLTTVSLGEGMIVLSRRHVLMSVPVALLVYSVIALVVALVVYAFRGAVVHPAAHLERQFESYTSWSTLGVLGGLLGMLTMSFMSLRR